MSPPPHQARTGVVLVQLGTPDAPTTSALRRYLREFLSDRRVVDLPRWFWIPLLYGIILTFRPRTSAALYQRIWTDQGSPLLLTSQSLTRKLQAHLGDSFHVSLGMRYGQPTMADALREVASLDRRLVVPLFPQYSETTTGSVIARVEELVQANGLPSFETLVQYYDHPRYIEAVATLAQRSRALRGEPQKWVFTYHGIPQRYADKGDPYGTHCQATTRALVEALELPEGSYIESYQSRVGFAPWLQPYTDEVFAELGEQNTRSLFAICPGFAADCLETLDEIAEVGQEQFAETGGGELHMVPAVNDSDEWVAALADIIADRLAESSN